MSKLNSRGQALVEYVLIIALISVACIGVINFFGDTIKNKITEASCSLVGQEYVVDEKTGEGACQ